MYKKQLGFQKLVCLLCVIAVAASFVYSLGIITDIYDSLYATMWDPEDWSVTDVPGSSIYYEMQDFNKQFVIAGIVLILLACLLYLTNTHVRRRYYIGNYVSIGAYSAAVLAVCAWSHQMISAFKVQYQTTVDFEALKEFSEMWDTPYMGPEDTFMLDLHYAVAGLCILAVVVLLANMIWKIILMRSEKKLIEAGKEASV